MGNRPEGVCLPYIPWYTVIYSSRVRGSTGGFICVHIPKSGPKEGVPNLLCCVHMCAYDRAGQEVPDPNTHQETRTAKTGTETETAHIAVRLNEQYRCTIGPTVSSVRCCCGLCVQYCQKPVVFVFAHRLLCADVYSSSS